MDAESDDRDMGEWVYCRSHVNPHRTGWCSVFRDNKVPLDATSHEEAFAECRRKGFRLFDDVRAEQADRSR